MATYTVTTTGDVVDPADGQLSLREALALTDSDPTTADSIVFDASVQGGTIMLAGSELTVASDVTIDGGVGVTIDAQQASRILSVRLNEIALSRSRSITSPSLAANQAVPVEVSLAMAAHFLLATVLQGCP